MDEMVKAFGYYNRKARKSVYTFKPGDLVTYRKPMGATRLVCYPAVVTFAHKVCFSISYMVNGQIRTRQVTGGVLKCSGPEGQWEAPLLEIRERLLKTASKASPLTTK